MAYTPSNPNGQATKANSSPVVIASDQDALAVTNALGATAAKQDTGNTSLSSIDGKITAVNTGAVVVASSALPSGAATAAKQPALGTAGSASADVITVQGRTSMTPLLVDPSAVTSPVSLASVPSHAVTNAGTFAVQATEADGANTTLGAKADAKSTATDTTAVTAMSVLKQISASVQAPPSQAVTNAGTFATQSTLQAGSAIVGKVTTDQTTHGTTDLVAADITKVAGTAADTNSGSKSAGTLRVVIATDQPALTNKLLVTPDSVALPANQSVNVAQMNGVTTTMGNGTSGTGVQRVAIASDNTAISGVGAAATAAAVPANATYKGLLAKTANPSAATDGNLVGALADKLGKQVVVGSIRDLKGVQQTTITSSTSETTIVTAVASTFLDLYGLILTNTSATVTKVTIKDSTAGTTRAVIEVPATDTRGFMLPESGGIAQATVNNNWTATCGTSVASIEITALYVKNT